MRKRRDWITSGRDREGERERTVEDVSKQVDDIRTGAVRWLRDEPGGCPSIGQVVSGMEAARVRSAASTRNVGRRVPILPVVHHGAQGREGVRRAAETVRRRVPMRHPLADRLIVVKKRL